jgi:hypothetical protein
MRCPGGSPGIHVQKQNFPDGSVSRLHCDTREFVPVSPSFGHEDRLRSILLLGLDWAIHCSSFLHQDLLAVLDKITMVSQFPTFGGILNFDD